MQRKPPGEPETVAESAATVPAPAAAAASPDPAAPERPTPRLLAGRTPRHLMGSSSSAADPAGGWEPDILGPGFEQRTLHLPPDERGDIVATLVRRVPAVPASGRSRCLRARSRRTRVVSAPGVDGDVDILYVHGWSDYFFQTELADFWTARGARFYAIDLRKYGRSLRPHQTPGFIDDLATYDEDIEAALAVMGHGVPATREPAASSSGREPVVGESAAPSPGRRLILMGHSTGGLTLSLWAARNPGRLAGLILNSPWLEFQAGQAGRALLTPVIDVEAHRRPRAPLPNVDLGFYTRAVSKEFGGEWEFNEQWRPNHGFRTTNAWLAAILRGQATVAAGLGIDVPILVLLSAQSTLATRWSERMRHTDTALDVTAIARRSLDLGTFTTIARIEGALHDVLLSEPAVRAVAYEHMARWAAMVSPAADVGPGVTSSRGER